MGILMDHFKKMFFFIRCIIQHLVKMIISVKKIDQKNHLFSCPMPLLKVNILLVNVDILVKLNFLKNYDFN
jgi:hypothetical protein